MNYFIGDLHLFNRNQTGEGVNYDGRPFATVDEMHRYIVFSERFVPLKCLSNSSIIVKDLLSL